MAIVKKTIQIGDQPTEEALKEVEEAAKKEIVYDFESPRQETWILHDFEPASDKYYKPKKEQITLKLDADIIAAFKSTGKGYQTRINEVLRKALFG